MDNGDHLTDRLRAYVRHLASGKPSRDAAKAAGFSDSYARVLATRTKKNHAVVQAIERIRAEGMKMAVYGLVEAMKEADDAAAFARQHKNPMALVKATELRAKLSGLLIDRIEVVPVDLRAALDRAEARVVNATQLSGPPCDASPSVAPLPNGVTRWRPHIPGDQGDPEAGPVDGQGGNAA